MTITLTKVKLALGVLVVALLVPATAYATHVFDDVPDSKFYTVPVEWAADNNITTGKSPTSFAPEDNVTRGESVTFLKRYNDNIVAPADAQLQAALEGTDDSLDQVRTTTEANEAAIGAMAPSTRLASDHVYTDVNDWTGDDIEQTVTMVAPADGLLLITHTVNLTEDRDNPAPADGDMEIFHEVEVDGTVVASTFNYFDWDLSYSANGQTIVLQHTEAVSAGTIEITGRIAALNGVFLDDGLAYVFDQGLTVLYVPLDGSGEMPVPQAAAPDARQQRTNTQD